MPAELLTRLQLTLDDTYAAQVMSPAGMAGWPAGNFGRVIADVLRGGPEKDVILAGGGDDVVYGGGGDDTLCAGAGSDFVLSDTQVSYEENGVPTISVSADAGSDTVYGSEGK